MKVKHGRGEAGLWGDYLRKDTSECGSGTPRGLSGWQWDLWIWSWGAACLPLVSGLSRLYLRQLLGSAHPGSVRCEGRTCGSDILPPWLT